MRNPLTKRYGKELKGELGKYIVIFVFIAFTIAFVSGFLVAGKSMLAAYNESFEKYNVEDGGFTLAVEAPEELAEKFADENDIKLYKNYSAELELAIGAKLRVFGERNEINKICLHEGRLPESADEIAIDRLFAKSNGLKIGDTVTSDNYSFKICGFVALPDYNSLFEKNSDMMMDVKGFGVGVVTNEAFGNFKATELDYRYSWKYNETGLTATERHDRAEEIAKNLVASAPVTEFTPIDDNQAVQFTGNDMGKDESIMKMLLYIIMFILAFVFAVTISGTVEKEAMVIGTLRASGYTRAELVRHYLTLPVAVTFVGAAVGNVLGYTVLKDLIAEIYYASYSLPVYETRWNAEAFVLTTVIPCAIMLAVNLFILIRRMRISPLRFLRRDIRSGKKKKAVKLPNIRFMSRFRLRVIFQNVPVYITMLVGVIFANVLLMFGLMINPLLEQFKIEINTDKICDYQYVLAQQTETENASAEKYAATALISPDGNNEEVTVYGIQDNSKYLDDYSGKICISKNYTEKYSFSVGDTLKLVDKYDKDKVYNLKIEGTYSYPSSLAVFMDIDSFNELFGNDKDYFNGYFSNEKLEDIDSMYVATVITEDDLANVADQMDASLGDMFTMINIFAVILYMMLIYLLTKLVIEKNANMISMVKILGYNNGEIRKLYISSNTIVVVLSILISLPISSIAMKYIYQAMMAETSGWLTFYINPWIYPAMIGLGIAAYFLVTLLNIRKIKRIPMSEALKNAE